MSSRSLYILCGVSFFSWKISSAQCVPSQPQNLQTTVNANNSVTVRWNVNCPSSCNNNASTSVVYYIGFYSQQSAAPNGLSGEYDFTTYVAPGCSYTELWDGFYRDSTSTADPKRSECFGILAFQRDVIVFQVVTKSFSVQGICNGNYGFGAGVMQWNFDQSYFCSGVTYDVMVWEIEVNVAPNALLTSADIACNDLYLDESAPAVRTGAFTYPGFIAPIAAPTVTITGSSVSNGVYSGQNNPVTIYCSDVFTFNYAVTPGCNFTESVAGYYQISSNFTFGAGVNNPSNIGLGVEDWFIFFANNIVNGNTGQPIPYIERDSIFHGFFVTDSTEVCILAQDPCNGSSSVTCIQFIIIDPSPVFTDFNYTVTPIDNCDSFFVQFTNNATGANAYLWDFGNGLVSTATTPSHTFIGTGPFDVTMIAIDTTVCDDRDTLSENLTFSFTPDTVDVNLNYALTYNQNCDSLTANFSASGTGIGSYFWDFGNGDTSSSPNNTMVYTDTGDYNVALIVTGRNACTTGDTIYEIVSFHPVFSDSTLDFVYDITYTNNCDTFIIAFTDSSNGINTYYWDFDNGNFSTDSNAIITYTSTGTFQVMLVASFNGQCVNTDTLYKTFILAPDSIPAIADFTFQTIPINNCDSLLVEFTNQSNDAYSFFWDFGNGITSTDFNATVLYTDTGAHEVTLFVTGLNACSAKDTLTRTFSFSPFINASVAAFQTNVLENNGCDSYVVEFINQSSGGTSYYWDAGNGITSSDTDIVITYTDTGDYNVMLVVNDNRRCSLRDTAYSQIHFQFNYQKPQAEFNLNMQPGCDLVEVSLENHSSIGFNYLWKVNNVVVGNTYSPNSSLLFGSPDTLMIVLEVVDTQNTSCSKNDTTSKLIIVPGPYGYTIANFGFSPIDPVIYEDVFFTDSSINAHPDFYEWSFGDGTTSSQINPVHFYEQPGTYEICLAVRNDPACPVPACKWLEIKDSEVIGLPTAFSPNGDNRNDIFIVRGHDIERIDLKIFNRWGELVFESYDPNIGWDGTYKAEPQEMDVYAFLLTAWLKNGRDFFRKGNVTLLR